MISKASLSEEIKEANPLAYKRVRDFVVHENTEENLMPNVDPHIIFVHSDNDRDLIFA